jgi:hypothetical protein
MRKGERAGCPFHYGGGGHGPRKSFAATKGGAFGSPRLASAATKGFYKAMGRAIVAANLKEVVGWSNWSMLFSII